MALLAGTASHTAPPGTGLAGEMYAAGVASGVMTANEASALFCTALASAIVAHITTNAVVVPALLVAPPGGGPVTGTGTVT